MLIKERVNKAPKLESVYGKKNNNEKLLKASVKKNKK